VVLLPKTDSWNVLFESLEGFSDDFMEERSQPEPEERDSPFDS
jgi:antitoxin VapB